MFETTAALGGLDLQLVYYRGFDECKASRLAHAPPPSCTASCARCAASAARPRSSGCLNTRSRETEKPAGRRAGLHRRRDGGEAPTGCAAWPASSARSRVPVFIFHEGDDPVAASAFRQIATLSQRRLPRVRPRQHRPPEGAARRRRGLCDRRPCRACRPRREEGRRGAAPHRATTTPLRRRMMPNPLIPSPEY